MKCVSDLILPEVLKETTLPVAKEAGTGLANLVNLFFTPIEMLKLYKDLHLENFLVNIKNKIDKIPIENVIPPSIPIITQILDNVTKFFYSEEDVQEYFSNLVAANMNTDTSKYVHPTFIEMIKNFSKVEMKIINNKLLSKNDSKGIYNIVLNWASPSKFKTSQDNETGRWIIAESLLPIDIDENALDISIAVSNLVRLRLVEINEYQYPVDGHYELHYGMNDKNAFKLYDEYIKHSGETDMREESYAGMGHTVDVEYNLIKLTPLGDRFVKCVLQ